MSRNIPVIIVALITLVIVGFVGVQWLNQRNLSNYWGNDMQGNGYWLLPGNTHIADMEKVDTFFYSKVVRFVPDYTDGDVVTGYSLILPKEGTSNESLTVSMPVNVNKSAVLQFKNNTNQPFENLNSLTVKAALLKAPKFILDVASRDFQATAKFDFVKSLTIQVDE